MTQIIIELSEEQSGRLCRAIGRMDGLRASVKDAEGDVTVDMGSTRPATLDEVHDRVVGYLASIVTTQETAMAQEATAAAVAPLGIALKSAAAEAA